MMQKVGVRNIIHVLLKNGRNNFVSPHKGAHCIARPGFRCAKWGLVRRDISYGYLF